VEQQDIQGSQGALTVAFETLSNKQQNENLKTLKKTRKIYTLYSTFKSWKWCKINLLGKKVPNIYDTFAKEGGPYTFETVRFLYNLYLCPLVVTELLYEKKSSVLISTMPKTTL